MSYTIPYKKEEIAKCSLDENGNVVDPITEELVDLKRLIIVTEGSATYCFDVETLQKGKSTRGEYLNPYTRQPLPGDIVKRIRSFEESLVRIFTVVQDGTRYNLNFQSNERLGELALQIIRMYPSRFDNAVNFDLVDASGKSLYDEDLGVITVGDRFREIPLEIHVNPVESLDRKEEIRRSLLKYTRESNQEGVANLLQSRQFPPSRYALPGDEVPRGPIYVGVPEPRILESNEVVDLTNRLNEIYLRNRSPDMYMRALRNELIPILMLYSGDARNIAESLPVELGPVLGEYAAHLIFSRVIDKENLSEEDPVESYYVDVPQDAPDYYGLDESMVDEINAYYDSIPEPVFGPQGLIRVVSANVRNNTLEAIASIVVRFLRNRSYPAVEATTLIALINRHYPDDALRNALTHFILSRVGNKSELTARDPLTLYKERTPGENYYDLEGRYAELLPR